MARLETQINQIYLTDPANKKASLILYEEQVSSGSHLFVLAELWDIKKKTENSDLKKISEIILESFRANKKLAAEALFEASLAQINQNLADLAHGGRKSWVGKFSAVLCLKSGDNIFIANNGACSCWLYRRGELLEILPSEKRGDHPFKTFVNFTQGKLIPADSVILNTANVFNYISKEHFSEILLQPSLEQASLDISKILQGSLDEPQAFCAFFLHFPKSAATPVAAPVALPIETIYAPLPEELDEPTETKFRLAGFSLPKINWPRFIPQLNLVKIPKIKQLRWSYFQNLSTPAKFFFISFSIFLILFLINLTNYLINYNHKKGQEKIQNQINLINQELTDAQSSIIYKNEDQALQIMNQAQNNFEILTSLDAAAAKKLESRLENIKTQINKISRVENPQIITTFKRDFAFLGKAPTAFLLAGADSRSLSQYSASSLKDYFLLNSLSDPVTGIAFMPGIGVVVSDGNSIHKINQEMQQFESVTSVSGGKLTAVRAAGNNLFALDMGLKQVLKLSFSKNKIITAKVATIESDEIRDIGADKDLYILSPDKLSKVSGNQSINIPLPNVTDGITNAAKLFVGSDLYIMEANKKRILIINKAGKLLNQIYFPNAQSLIDFYVDEAARSIYLLDDKTFQKITF